MGSALSFDTLSFEKTLQNTVFHQLSSKHVNLCQAESHKTL